MIKVINQEHFDKVMAFAKDVGAEEEFQKQLDYLGSFACPDNDSEYTQCTLGNDWAENSFSFSMHKRVNGEYKYWFSGGLIYCGPGLPLDGSAPQLTVSLSPSKKIHSWSVHT